jgi:serpin B
MALGLLAGSVVGCGLRGTSTVVRADVVRSDKPRLAAPSPADVPDLVEGNTRFALDLYRVLYDPEANLFCSPYSISQALAMTYAGARGDTERAMAGALRFALPQERLHPAFNALDQALASRGEGDDEQGQRFRLHVANALWGQKGFDFQPAFLDLLAQSYGAGLRVLDFAGAPEPSRETINHWVEDQTEDKIKDLLPQGSIDLDTRLVLSNAVYFNADWMHPFVEGATQDGAFHLLDGNTVTVPLMRLDERLGYGEGQGYQAVELPYVGGELAMVVLLPAEGNFEAFAKALDAARLSAVLQGIQRNQVTLTLPKFKYESGAQLKDALSGLGMKEAFSMAADFSGMTGRKDLYVDEVYHKAFVAVDEKGTEAAAATAVVANLVSAPAQEPKEVRVDRPFIFLIRDVQTGTILFLGHLVNPAG